MAAAAGIAGRLSPLAASPLGKLVLDVGALGAGLVAGFVAGAMIEDSAGLEVIPAWLELLSVAALAYAMLAVILDWTRIRSLVGLSALVGLSFFPFTPPGGSFGGIVVLLAWGCMVLAAVVMTLAHLFARRVGLRRRASGTAYWLVPIAAAAVVVVAPLGDVRFGLGADTMTPAAREILEGRDPPLVRRVGLFRVEDWTIDGSCVSFITGSTPEILLGVSGVEYCPDGEQPPFTGADVTPRGGGWYEWSKSD